jgi:hypothetical protein
MYANGNMSHGEIANMFSGAEANVFVFVDHCGAGGLGDDLMGLPNSDKIYYAATCSASGSGYDGSNNNGAWTWQFLEWGLIGQFSNSSTANETCFDTAKGSYPHSGADTPEEYDGSTGDDSYIWGSGKKALPTNQNQCFERPVSNLGTLAGKLVSATQATVATYNMLDVVGTETVRSADTIDKILTAIGKSQPILTYGPRCLFDKAISFRDDAGVELGKVGICKFDLPREDHPSAFIPTGTDGRRYGIYVEDIASLSQAL